MSDEMGYTLLVLIPILLLFPLTYWVHKREERHRADQKRCYIQLAKSDLDPEQLKALQARLNP